jgi:hypothetical protein
MTQSQVCHLLVLVASKWIKTVKLLHAPADARYLSDSAGPGTGATSPQAWIKSAAPCGAYRDITVISEHTLSRQGRAGSLDFWYTSIVRVGP